MENNKEKEVTMEDINRFSQVVNSDLMRKDIEDKKKDITGAKDALLDAIIDPEMEKAFLEEKLRDFKTVEQLKKHLEKNENVVEMFTNPVTGEVLDITVTNDQREIDFRRDLLLYLKESDVQMALVDAEYEKLDNATKEFQTEIGEACYALADNVLTYIQGLKDRATACQNTSVKAKINKSILAIESGFTMELYKDTYTKYPSAVERCKHLIDNENEIVELGQRYMSKLKSAKTKVNLFEFVSSDTKKSFEEMVFAPDEYKSKPDILVISLIRYFSMANWNDVSTIQAHATIVLNMRKLVVNDIDEEVKTKLKMAMLEYLKLFE